MTNDNICYFLIGVCVTVYMVRIAHFTNVGSVGIWAVQYFITLLLSLALTNLLLNVIEVFLDDD